jgi:hypothetical protein
MKSKRLPLWLGIIGTLLLVPGALWVASSRNRLSDDDARITSQPLNRIHIGGIDQRQISATLVIPNTKQWTKIRKIWGEPEFVISVLDTAGRITLCLPELPVRIELIDPTGSVIPLQPGAGPYGSSPACESSSLRFHAAPGNELTLKLAGTRPGAVPTGDLIVVNDWFNTKDKLVGLYLDEFIESFVKWLAVLGFLLVLSGAGTFLRNRIRHHAVN